MASFWDARAEEDAFYFIDNRLEYGHPDLERFWADGERDLDRLLQPLDESIDPHDEVLEIGCGVGRLTRAISSRAASVRALDVSPRMLELAKQHNSTLANVVWIRGDGTTLDGVGSASADACISHVVFQHIPDPGVTLNYVREMGRVLRVGGWAAFQISNDPRIHAAASIRRRIRDRLLASVGRLPSGQHDSRWRGSMIELSDLRRTAAEAAMDVEHVIGEGQQFCLVLTRRH